MQIFLSLSSLGYGEEEEGRKKVYSFNEIVLVYDERGKRWKIKAFHFRFSDGISPVFLHRFEIIFIHPVYFVSFPRDMRLYLYEYIFLNFRRIPKLIFP